MTATATISINTNPAIAGRYSIAVANAKGAVIGVRVTDTPVDMIRKMTAVALANGVFLETADATGE